MITKSMGGSSGDIDTKTIFQKDEEANVFLHFELVSEIGNITVMVSELHEWDIL